MQCFWPETYYQKFLWIIVTASKCWWCLLFLCLDPHRKPTWCPCGDSTSRGILTSLGCATTKREKERKVSQSARWWRSSFQAWSNSRSKVYDRATTCWRIRRRCPDCPWARRHLSSNHRVAYSSEFCVPLYCCCTTACLLVIQTISHGVFRPTNYYKRSR